MSTYQRKKIIKQESQSMKFLGITIVFLFSIVMFCSYAVPMLKDTYGTTYIASTQ